MAEAALGIICVVLVFAIPIGLLIGAAMLMGAVALANKCLPQPRGRYDDYEDDWEDERPQRSRKRNAKTAVPAPTFNRAVVIVLVNALAGFVVGLVLGGFMAASGLANNPAAALLMQGVQIVLGFLVAAGIRTAMLPTTFPRACLVVLFEILIAFAIVIVIAIPIVLIAGLAGAGLR